VDFAARQHLLAELRPVLDRLEQEQEATAEREVQDLLTHWSDGRIKYFVTTRGMRFRRQHRALMLHGAYTPLEVDGEGADHVVASARHDDSRFALGAVALGILLFYGVSRVVVF
jgi:maltooligosyltrehalose synthase